MAEPSSIYDKIAKEQKASNKKDPSAVYDAFKAGTEENAKILLESDFELGVYAPNSLRWSLARGDNFEEKKVRLQRKYPEGELDTLKQSTVLGFEEDALIFRESPESKWKMVEPQGFDKFDIAEAIAPSLESIIGETAIAIGSGGTTIPMTVFRQSLGALAGESVEQGFQAIFGTQRQSPFEVAGEVGTEAGASAIGGFAMSPFAGLYNAARGAGALRVGEEGRSILRAAGELDDELLRKMTPGLVTDNPAIRLSEAQSSAILPGLVRRYRDLISKLDSAVKSGAPGNSATAMDDTVIALKDFSDYFLAKLPVIGRTAKQGGEALKEGVEEYSKASYRVVQGLYNKAREIADPEFDFQPILNMANDLKAGSKGELDSAVNKQIAALMNIKGPKELSDGSFLSVTDQIRAVRTELWSLKHVKPGDVPNQATGQANDLYKAVTDVLKNPKNSDPAFLQAWDAANEAASLRLTTLDKAPIVALAKTETPAKLARTYMRPGEVDNLIAIRDTVSPERWAEFKDAAYSELLRDPANLTSTLKAYDQETLDLLMSPAEKEQFFRIGKELDRIYSVGADDIAATQVKNRNFIDTLITEADPAKALTIIRAANNTNNRQLRQSLRSAIMEWAWDGVVVPKKSGLIVNEPLLKAHVQKLKRSGMWGILSSEEKRIISNAEIVARAFQEVQDAGTSIQGAEAVSGLKKLQASAIYTFMRAELLAQFYTSNLGRKLLIGGGLPNSNVAMLRAFGGALAQTLPPEDISTLIEENE